MSTCIISLVIPSHVWWWEVYGETLPYSIVWSMIYDLLIMYHSYLIFILICEFIKRIMDSQCSGSSKISSISIVECTIPSLFCTPLDSLPTHSLSLHHINPSHIPFLGFLYDLARAWIMSNVMATCKTSPIIPSHMRWWKVCGETLLYGVSWSRFY